MFSWVSENREWLFEIYFFSSYILSMIINFVILYMKSMKNTVELDIRWGPPDDFFLFALWLASPITFPFMVFRFHTNLMELYHGRNTF